eukprot:gnl/Hemi2/290_TR85_c0_g1_i1.p2 gnl/Hemi2/290_TR85_c0_g1~~gnl/Hemi2/290_TR85_c0_g1_i1.p2  ORF type:complete len:172 (-),score=4.23 gnl/Hemi2/290_TR85_c0_g1_i1:761-1276(-)
MVKDFAIVLMANATTVSMDFLDQLVTNCSVLRPLALVMEHATLQLVPAYVMGTGRTRAAQPLRSATTLLTATIEAFVWVAFAIAFLRILDRFVSSVQAAQTTVLTMASVKILVNAYATQGSLKTIVRWTRAALETAVGIMETVLALLLIATAIANFPLLATTALTTVAAMF